jgi:cytochrome P450
MAGTVQQIDLASQAFGRNPFPTYASLREVGPVFQSRLPLLGKTWVATTYQAASEVLKDDETFVMEAKKAGKTLFSGILQLLPRLLQVFSDNMLAHDNPDHRRLRRLVEQAFSRHSVETMRGRIGVLCDGLLAELAMAFLLLFAGFETTAHLLSGGTLALLKTPEQKERLLNDWSLLPPAMEELLRFVCPVQMSEARHVTRDLEFHGQSLRRGDNVVALLGAANAGPARLSGGADE